MYKLSRSMDFYNPGNLRFGTVLCHSQYAERHVKIAEVVAAG